MHARPRRNSCLTSSPAPHRTTQGLCYLTTGLANSFARRAQFSPFRPRLSQLGLDGGFGLFRLLVFSSGRLHLGECFVAFAAQDIGGLLTDRSEERRVGEE